MPRKSRLAKNRNLRRKPLYRKIYKFRNDTVYAYILTTIECRDGHLRQFGSAPNFQGGMITLCSCKHWMRTFRDTESWEGVWIAGYTNRDLGNKLFYLMRVSEAYKSHRDLWQSDRISEKTKAKKDAHLSRFGDIYQPKNDASDDFSPLEYVRPCRSHVHRNPDIWHEDIDYYSDRQGRRPALLVGDPKYSFLWDKAVASYPRTLYRGQKRAILSDLFPSIEPGHRTKGRRSIPKVVGS